MEVPVAAAALWIAAHELLLISSLCVLLFALDDLFVDLVYFAGWIARRLTIYRRVARSTVKDLPSAARSGRFAIFVPAWDEGAVIGDMLRHLTATLDYPAYDVFVGVYPNDPATRRAVAGVNDHRIRIVTASAAGPTTKADCLNHLWDALLSAEAESGVRYKGVVLHDAEDAVHRDELKIFDYLLPKRAMVQLPVVPVPDRASRWISGHYCDEFAEHHGKNMIVRELLGAALPSAGVACAFEREALAKVAAERGGAPFDPAAMTEDYELGILTSRIGRGAFVRLPAGRGEAAVSTREHFPASFDAALRQKTRWLVGIAFQGWDRLRWSGSWADRYMMLRDRKPVANAVIIVLAYAAMSLALVVALYDLAAGAESALPPLAPHGSRLAALLIATSAVLAWRLLVRAGFTWRLYGAGQGLLSIPRSVVANVFAVASAYRATGVWLLLLLRRQPLTWQKTSHRFPDDEALCAR